jgi:hypothetical protein
MPDKHSEVSRSEMRIFVQDQAFGPWGYAPEGRPGTQSEAIGD